VRVVRQILRSFADRTVIVS